MIRGAVAQLEEYLNGIQGQGKTLWPFFYAGFRLKHLS